MPRLAFATSFRSTVLTIALVLAPAAATMAGEDLPRSPTAEVAERVRSRRERDAESRWNDRTFRPTVLVRRGTSQGTGTIIASLEGETLVATAGHVIRGDGPIQVELHRYNLGLEKTPATPGKWPRRLEAEQAAIDPSADVAILRIRSRVALPYVARIVQPEEEPAADVQVTSLGIDLGTKLGSWDSRLVDVLWFELNDSRAERPFLVTARIPEHGRSGGGLFDRDGRLVGVCVGHAEVVKGRRMGIFSSAENLLELLHGPELSSIMSRSEARLARMTRRSEVLARRSRRPPLPAVTATEAPITSDAAPSPRSVPEPEPAVSDRP
ncbi:S1 family peptidase [Aquisphaera insulae]|uniref:S1 family peptidase n=1 Tax=Aquisphaera insulae TaxID=2712864 RepID=UPI0013ECF020|nr:serine protease [Aquisphaera insulae]